LNLAYRNDVNFFRSKLVEYDGKLQIISTVDLVIDSCLPMFLYYIKKEKLDVNMISRRYWFINQSLEKRFW